MPDSFPKSSENSPAKREPLPTSHSALEESEVSRSNGDVGTETSTTNVERPVDLYKAIFSDDSDEEADTTGISSVADPDKKIEGANTTLNLLVAGDFLESIGKELGLEVPSERPSPGNKSILTGSTNKMDITNSSRSDKPAATFEFPKTHMRDEKNENSLNITGTNSTSGREADHDNGKVSNNEDNTRKGKTVTSTREETDRNSFDLKDSETKGKKREHRSKKHRSHSGHHRHHSSSDTNSSSDHGYYGRSKSRSEKREKRASSRQKSKHHSDHHSRKRSRSPARYSSHDKDRYVSDDSRKDRKSMDREKHSHKKHR